MKMTQQTLRKLFRGSAAVAVVLSGASSAVAQDASKEELRQRVAQLEDQLAETRSELLEAKYGEGASSAAEEKLAEVEAKLAQAADTGPSKITPGDVIPALEGLKIGGAIRANYAIGDYGAETGGASRAEGDGGNFGLDTFRINMDYTNDQFVGKLEYRFYNGYNFLHTGWLGYNFQDDSQLQVGANRVPFGPGAYGVSQSWFFDQHYYVGLSDDMDFGAKYSTSVGDVSLDLGYYISDEGQWTGNSNDGARYSYDVIDESGNGYEERNQFNVRAIYSGQLGEVSVDWGASLQYGMMESNGAQDDGDHYALSFHPVFKLNNWTLAPQLTYYEYDIDGYLAGDPDGDLIQIGAYDFPTLLATEAWIPAVSLSYYYETNQVDWLDYVIPYAEYSSIMKEADGFNDSELVTFGAAWGRGGWFIYTDLVMSNGNDFVGTESGFNGAGSLGRFGANLDDDWETRFNINFGYYF